MLTNNDGSRYCLETVEEIINARCDQQPWPYMSDVIGSDWAAGHHYADPPMFRAAALRVARRFYTYSYDLPENEIGAR